MSEEENKNNTSSIDQVAAVVATTNDDVSSSLNDTLFGSSSSSTLVNGGSLSSNGSASLADLASAGSLGSGAESLASVYSAAALSALDQTYYAGTLGRATPTVLSDVATLTTTPPTQNKDTYTIATSRQLWLYYNNQMSPATNAGQANLYSFNTKSSVLSWWHGGFGIDTTGKAQGAAIYEQKPGLDINAGGTLSVGARSQLWIGNEAAVLASSGNLALQYAETSNAYTPGCRSLYMQSSSYLSAAGYLGGVADKSQAGTALSDKGGLRTNAVQTDADVVMDVGGDWGTVGNVSNTAAPQAIIGNNNKITTGGNIGVFMNASVTVGNSATMEVAVNSGSGFFIGSGGLFSAGTDGNYLVHGGMGAAYLNTTLNTSARLILGNNTSVTLDQANWGNFAAQAGGVVSVADSFYLRALELSVGYGQVTSTGAILGSEAATMVIGNNATISLAQEGLTDNGKGFYVGNNGAMTLDANAAQLSIGTNATIMAKTISIGNYAKVYSGTDPRDNKAKSYSYYTRGSNNTITIGAGANVTLSGGIALDGNNNTLTFASGGGGTINAGSISAGRFYEEYAVAFSGKNYVFDDTSGTTFTVGDGYTITLTSATIQTGLANDPTISNNGNLELNTVSGNFTFGNNISINANSMVIGDYYNSTTNGVFTGATNNASMTYGTSTTINLSGAVLLNGESDRMSFTDHLTLNASTMSLGLGPANSNAQNTHFSAGTNATVTLQNGLIDNLNNGIVNFGTGGKLQLLDGDLAMGGSGVGDGRTWFQMGDNNALILNTGSILMNGTAQAFTFGAGAQITANVLSYAGTNQSFSLAGTGNVNFSGGIVVDATGGTGIILGDSTTLSAGGSGIVLNSTDNFTAGASNNITASSITFNAVTNFTAGANGNVTAGDITFNAAGNFNKGANGAITAAGIAFNAAGNFSAGVDNAITATGITFNTSANFNVDTGGSLTVNGDVNFTSNAGGAVFNIGANKTFQANNFIINAVNPSLTFGTSINYNIGAWNLNGATNSVVLGDGATGSLGDINTTSTGGTFNTGSANGASFGAAAIGGSSNTFIVNGTATGGSIALTGDSQTFSMSAGTTLGLSAGITVDATNSNLTVFDGSTLSVATDIKFNQKTTFSYGSNGTLSVTGAIELGNSASGTAFSIGNNTTFNVTNFNVYADNPTLSFGTGIHYTVTEWQLSGANNKVLLGDGSTGSLGNISVIGTASGAVFDTGNSDGLSFTNATLINDAVLNLNGSVTGTSLSLSGTASVNVAAGKTVDIGTLTMDGSSQVVINVGSGATLNIHSLKTIDVGSSNLPKIVLNGGTVVIDGQTTRASSGIQHEVNFAHSSTDANGIYQYNGDIETVSGNLTVSNFALTDKLVFQVTNAYTDENRYITSYADGILTVNYVNEDGTVKKLAQFNYTPADSGQDIPGVIITAVDTNVSPTGYTITITKCFLTGTHILTPEGEVTVENLKAGDQVITMQNGQQVSQRVVWAGCMDVNVNNYEHKDALYPVRIKAHAFGLNQPCRDLLVTPEHTIYVDGGLIPARMLVNGRSIITDTSMDRFTVYHIETEAHSVLLSENLTTESYLNTDDRHLFNGDAVNLHLTFNENAGHQSWENDAAAPLTVARHQVEPIWQRLNHRATQQGYAFVSKPEVTNDPALCLITQKGEKLHPVDIKGNSYSFYVPANVRIVAMHSRAALPSEVVGPFLDDRRMLGVLVAQISVLGERNMTILPADMTGLSGWHPAELNRSDRWTKGLATLPETIAEVSGKMKLVKIELTATAEYFADTINFAEKIA